MVRPFRSFGSFLFLLTFILNLGAVMPLAAKAKAPVVEPTPEDDGQGADTADDTDLSQMSLENLANLDVKVTSSAKKPESLRNATSAIYVITQEDIHRSAARTLPDLLAMVPGLQVARQ